MPLSSALRFFGVWSGPWYLWDPDQSTCVCRLYMALTQAFFCPPSCKFLILNRGVVWRSIQSVFTPLFTRLLLFFSVLQDMCICMLSVVSPSPRYGLFFPPKGDESEYEGALSRRVHALT